MRVTRTNPIPEEEIDKVFFPYYEKDNLLKVLQDDRTFLSKDIRSNLKKSIFDDYGYDVYSLFENPDDKNFVSVDEIYEQRIKDFSNFFINSFGASVQGDFDRINSLANFKDSELYKEICEKTDDNLERCKILMEVIGQNQNQNGGGSNSNSLNFGYQDIANQIQNNNSSGNGGRGNKQSQNEGDINNKMDLASEFSNALKDPKQAQDLKDALAGSRTLGSGEKDDLGKVIDALKKEMLPNGGKGHGKLFQTITQILKGIDWSHFYAMNIGNKNSAVNTFKSTKEIESSNLPIDGFRMRKIKRSEQVTRASIFEMAMDDDLFYGKFLNQELIVKDYIRQRKISQAFYVLMDVSGSMDGVRKVFARSVVKELLRRVVKEGAKYFFRAFDDRAFELHSATNKEEAEKLDKYLSTVEFDGGGTSIKTAIETAVSDIKKDKAKFEDIDILVLTDGEDSFNLDKEEMKGITLHTFLINEGYDKKFGETTKEKIKKMTKKQLDNFYCGVKSLIVNSDNFEVANPLEQIKLNNALLKSAVDANIKSDEFRHYSY